jgi:hypothetical protein
VVVGQPACAGAPPRAPVRIVSTDPQHVIGVVRGVAPGEPGKESAIRRARIATYSPTQDDVADGSGRYVGKANVSVFRLQVDCRGVRIRAVAADYFQWPDPTRAYHADYDKALFIPAEEDQTRAIVTAVCAGALGPAQALEVAPDLEAFVQAAKARF